MAILLDTNVLLRWQEFRNPDYLLINRVVDQLLLRNENLFYTAQNISEFWNTLTRPISSNGFGYSPNEADERVSQIESKFKFLSDEAEQYLVWRMLVVKYQVRGVQVHDARLVATMLHHGVTRILTFNAADFTRYKEIEALHPAVVAKET